MNVTGKLRATFDVPEDRIAELIATTLPETNWVIAHFNEALCKASATRKHNTESFGIYWQYEYRASVSWKTENHGYQVVVEVEDVESKSSEEQCKELCAEILRRAKKNVALMRENPVPRKTTYGSARWAQFDDLKAAGYVVQDGKIDPRSFIVAPAPDERLIIIPPEQSIMHAVVCGATGTGKTSGFVIPQAVKRLDISAIFTEATDGPEPPAVYSKTARWRAEQGKQDIYYFNPADPTSNQINLIEHIRKPEDSGIIAQLIVNNTKQSLQSGGDPFWEKAERYLLNALLIHAAGEKKDLAWVRWLVGQGAKALEEVMANSYYQRARDEYAAFCRTGSETTRGGVFIGLLQRLEPWQYPTVAKVTERTDFDLEGLANRLFSFYLAVPAEQESLHPVAALVLNYLLDAVVQADRETGETMKHGLMLVLDEFTNFGRIPAFAKKMTLVRHRGIGVTLGFQSIKQLQVVYGRDEADWIMSQPGTRIFMRPRDLDTAESISKMLGQRTHYERKWGTNGQLVEVETGLPLLGPSEVMALEMDKAILFSPATDPIKIDKFHWLQFEKATSLPTWKRRKLLVEEKLVRAGEGDLVAAPPDSREERTRDFEQRDVATDERAPDF